MVFRPYIGSRTIEHFGDAPGAPHTSMTYGSDQSGTIHYEFNALGFRGPEPKLSAERSIYVCGCSHTFGTGNQWADTWPTPFAQRYAEREGVAFDDISLMNFAEGGTSNRYISRTLIDQCKRRRPDLAIAHFTEVGRTEYLFAPGTWEAELPTPDSKSFAGVGPWQSAGWLKRQAWLLRDFRGVERNAAAEILRWARAYYTQTYRTRRAAYETIQEMLLFQFACEAMNIDYLMCCVDYRKLAAEVDNASVRVLWELLDHDRVADFSVDDAALRLDEAADRDHPGAESHAAFAEKFFGFYEAAQSSSNASL